MKEVKFAQSDETILITGSTGTGKSRMAKRIHDHSSRASRRFLHVNLCNFSNELFQSELFGHVKGSFTGAGSDKKGFFERVGQGTLFLDELGEISMETQAKLLMVLEEGIFYPIGSTSPVSFDGRIIFATNKNLEKMVEKGTFREDLFFRIRTFELKMSSLKEMPDFKDVVEREFLNLKLNHCKSALILEADALAFIESYDWPGNYRELLNVLNYVVLMAQGTVKLSDFPSYLQKVCSTFESSDDYHSNLADFERRFLQRMLEKREFRINKTARETNISKVTLLAKIKKYDIKIETKNLKQRKA